MKNQQIVRHPQFENGTLNWYGYNLEEVASAFGTPVHFGCSEAVQDSYRWFMEPFEQAGLPFKMYYSVKTNPVPYFLSKLHDLGCGFETVGGWEYEMLKALGVKDRQIIHTGDPKLSDKNESAVPGLEMYTVSTLGHLHKLIELQNHAETPIPVGLTINPQLIRGFWDITLNTSRKGSPLGFHPTSDDFDHLIKLISKNKGLKLNGLQMHLGSGIGSATPYLKGIDTLVEAAKRLKHHNIEISLLDIGGGFSLPTAPMMKIRRMVTSLLGIRKSTKQIQSSSYLDTIALKLKKAVQALQENDIQIEAVAAEPGRIISGPCQVIMLTIFDTIDKDNKNYLVCDAGAMSLSPMLLSEDHRLLPLSKNNNQQVNYEVLGKLPSALDRVSAAVTLPKMNKGDQLAVLDTGAYFVSMNNTFNGPLPPILWGENGQLHLARQNETEEDLFKHYQLLGNNLSRSL